ncbi:MAG: accessory gene regulator B family protein [Eubacteriales bacterium]
MKQIIENLATIITKDNNEEKEVVVYGLERATELFFNILTTIVLALLFGMILETIIFAMTFFFLRSYSGGVHARNGVECYFFSTIMLATVLSLQKFEFWKVGFNNLAFFGGILMILLIAPIGDKNKPLDEVEKKYYRKKVYQILAVIVLIYTVTTIFTVEVITINISLAMLVVSMSLILGKIKNSLTERG